MTPQATSSSPSPPALPAHLGRWFRAAEHATPNTPPLRGVALVVHGLNLFAPRMDPLCRWLCSRGFDVLRVSLSGHGEIQPPDISAPSERQGRLEASERQGRLEASERQSRLEAFRQTSYALWRDELTQATRIARAHATALALPLTYVGFSLGGLLGNNLLNRPSLQITYDRMVLLAPAIVLPATAGLLRLLRAFPRMLIPSFTPRAYLANRYTPIAAYNALLDAHDELLRSRFKRSHIPALVIGDIHDEFVPYLPMVRTIQEHNLPWEIHPLHQKNYGKRSHFHLLIDEASLGADLWHQMTQRIARFLTTSIP